VAVTTEYFRADVLAATRLSTHFVRLVLGGPGLADFDTTGVPDEWVRLFLPPPGQRHLEPPVPSGPGWDWRGPTPEGRYYTVRRWDHARREMVVDVVVHDHGLVTAWAQGDCVGDQVVLSAPRGSFTPPAAPEWTWLVGDLTALPAIGRILEELPPGLRVRVDVEAPGGVASYPLDDVWSRADLELNWLERRPSRNSVSGLAQHVRASGWPGGDGYFWMAGEAGQMRALRKHLRHELGRPASSYDVMGYWRVDAEQWLARYDASGVDVARIWAEGERAGKDADEIWDDYEAVLARAGL